MVPPDENNKPKIQLGAFGREFENNLQDISDNNINWLAKNADAFSNKLEEFNLLRPVKVGVGENTRRFYQRGITPSPYATMINGLVRIAALPFVLFRNVVEPDPLQEANTYFPIFFYGKEKKEKVLNDLNDLHSKNDLLHDAMEATILSDWNDSNELKPSIIAAKFAALASERMDTNFGKAYSEEEAAKIKKDEDWVEKLRTEKWIMTGRVARKSPPSWTDRIKEEVNSSKNNEGPPTK